YDHRVAAGVVEGGDQAGHQVRVARVGDVQLQGDALDDEGVRDRDGRVDRLAGVQGDVQGGAGGAGVVRDRRGRGADAAQGVHAGVEVGVDGVAGRRADVGCGPRPRAHGDRVGAAQL